MYEIRIDDIDTEHVLGVHVSFDAAATEVERVIAATHAQLLTNGEGHARYWLRLLIRDADDGSLLAVHCTGMPAGSCGRDFGAPPACRAWS